MSKQTNMVREKDIINGLCKADTCSVPDGYFASLQDRLVSIPKEYGRRQSPVRRAAPYLALAASMAAIVLVGGLFLSKPSGMAAEEDAFSPDGSMYEQLLYADAMPTTYSLYDFFEDAANEADASIDEYYDYINQ